MGDLDASGPASQHSDDTLTTPREFPERVDPMVTRAEDVMIQLQKVLEANKLLMNTLLEVLQAVEVLGNHAERIRQTLSVNTPETPASV